MRYEIVATLGPASDSESTWRAMLSAGVTAFRLNTSHLSSQQLGDWLERLGVFLTSIDSGFPLVLDLQGSKWRLGEFTPFELEHGQRVELICATSAMQAGVLPVPHQDFFAAAAVSSQEIVLNDARSRLIIESIRPDSISTSVAHGGRISPRKGITFAASNYRKESLNEKDRAILEQTRGLNFVRYALSYVKDAVEMARYRVLFGPSAYLIAKVERKPAIDQGAQVAASANELWLCRGDLGAELGPKTMAESVHHFSELPVNLTIPVLMAGQVLEHMSECPSPTRSEVCYLYDTLVKGYRGFVLSDETAIGRYPLESCRTAALFRN